MTFFDQSDYGQLNDLVSNAGVLIAAAVAMYIGWRKRARWEPSEVDIPYGPQRVSSLLTAVFIAILWSERLVLEKHAFLNKTAIFLVIATVCFLCFYSILVGIYTYEKVTSPTTDEIAHIKIIGGFRLTPRAREEIHKRDFTIQELFKGSAYDPDKVWTRVSRAFAKVSFVICYIGLTASGTITLACASIILGLSR